VRQSPGNIGHYDSPRCQSATRNRFLYYHYFNISGLLPWCKKWKNCAFVGPPFCGGPCSVEHAEHV